MNLEQLRQELSLQAKELRNGSLDPKRANAMCNTAGKIIGCIRLEMEYAKMMGIKPNMKFITDKSRRQK